MAEDLIILGAGGYAREILEWIDDINEIKPTWNVKGLLDDNLNALENKHCKYKIIGKISDWKVEQGQKFVMGIANPAIKERLSKDFEDRGAEFVSIIHPSVRISENFVHGKGIVIYPDATINTDCTAGDFVTLLGCTGLGHDANVGDYSTICGSCGINGYVVIGKRVFLGGHVSVAPGKKIGDDSVVGIGSVVITNVKSGTTVFGNPACKV